MIIWAKLSQKSKRTWPICTKFSHYE